MEPSCKNCGAELHGEWCHECGQRAMKGRWTVKSAFTQLFSAITNVERGFLFTIIQMAIRPGTVIKDYIEGKTRPYFPPFRYAFILVTISAVLTVWSGIFDTQQEAFSYFEQADQTESQAVFQQQLGEGIKRFLNLLIIIVLPFYALSTWLLLRKKGYNYAEHMIASIYLVGQTSFYGIFMVPLYFFAPDMMTLSMGVSLIITAVVVMQIVNGWMGIPRGEAFAYGVISAILGQILMFIFIAIVSIVVVVLLLLFI